MSIGFQAQKQGNGTLSGSAASRKANPISLTKAKAVAKLAGKIAGGGLVLITVAYFWASMNDLSPEYQAPHLALQAIAVISLAPYLTVEALQLIGIYASARCRKAAEIACMVGPWLSVSLILIGCCFALVNSNPATMMSFGVGIFSIAFASGWITKKWAKTKPYLAGCLILLTGSFSIIVAVLGIAVITITASLAILAIALPIMLAIIPAIFRAM